MSTDAQTSPPSTHDSTDRPSTEGDASAAAAKKLTEFNKVVADLLRDLLTTFPELQPRVDDILTRLSEDETVVYEHCKQKLPDKFFDILYQNDKLFSLEADNEFLPGISFGHLWRENISDATRATLWKYLQLLLFTVVGGLSDGSSFGDTAKLFESVNQDEFKSKLEETVAQMHDLFSAKGAMPKDGEESDEAPAGINLDDLPNPNDLHDHVNSMMKGKLGELAREIAEETAADLNMGNASSVQDVFKNLMQNPAKLMNIVKSVGTKLDQKMKAGDMKESDLLKEANDMMQQMKNMPGMSSMQSMFAKMGMDLGSMGMGGAGGGAKVNVNAMQANIQRSMGAAKQRERMKERLLAKQALQEQMQMQMQMQQPQQLLTAPTAVFSKGEVVERSLPSDKPALEATTVPKKKNKHKKKT
jgi:hypothetical protein